MEKTIGNWFENKKLSSDLKHLEMLINVPKWESNVSIEEDVKHCKIGVITTMHESLFNHYVKAEFMFHADESTITDFVQIASIEQSFGYRFKKLLVFDFNGKNLNDLEINKVEQISNCKSVKI